MKKFKYFLEKVVYCFLLFNPLIFAGLSVLITPWLSWVVLIMFLILSKLPATTMKSWPKIKNFELLGKISTVLHILMIIFAIGFTLDAIWPNLYANIWQGITGVAFTLWQLIIHNPWIFIVAVIVVVIATILKMLITWKELGIIFNHQLNMREFSRLPRESKSFLLYMRLKLHHNKLQDFELSFLHEFYSYKTLKKYFELVISEENLINRELAEFKPSSVKLSSSRYPDILRIFIVLNLLEVFAERYKNEEDIKLVKDFFYRLVRIVNNYIDSVSNSEIISQNKKNRLRRAQILLGTRILDSPLIEISIYSEINFLVSMAKEEQEKKRKEKEKALENAKKAMANGHVGYFIHSFDELYSEELFKEFFKNLSLDKFREKKIIEVSKFKKSTWNNSLDYFFARVSDIAEISMDDELLSEMAKAIKRLSEEIEEKGDDNLKKVILKKKREMPHYLTVG